MMADNVVGRDKEKQNNMVVIEYGMFRSPFTRVRYPREWLWLTISTIHGWQEGANSAAVARFIHEPREWPQTKLGREW